MTNEPTLACQSTVEARSLHVALELSASTWVLCFAFDGRFRTRSVQALDVGALLDEIGLAKRKLGAPDSICVKSCYEAGRDGFWLHRWLCKQGIENVVVDSSSIHVDRRKRRAKTDRLDARSLVALLVRHHEGRDRVWSVVEVPSREAEDDRRLGREIETLTHEVTERISRIHSLLATMGARLGSPKSRSFLAELSAWRGPDGQSLPPQLLGQIRREHERMMLASKQRQQLSAERRKVIDESPTQAADMMRNLRSLRGIGETGAFVFVTEAFAWRTFDNRKKAGAFVGLCGTPYLSGNTPREQGISKAGPGRLRALIVQLAWSWLRWQPNHELSLWFNDRFGSGRRSKKIGIVALARKLWIALWRLAHQGIVPRGALINA